MKKYIKKVNFHLPALFCYFNLYEIFLSIYEKYPECFYDNVNISSIYDSPAAAIWNGGRGPFPTKMSKDRLIYIRDKMNYYNIHTRFAFSNSQLKENHLSDEYCNEILDLFADSNAEIIVASDLLKTYIENKYKDKFSFISSTTKCILNIDELNKELNENYKLVVLDYRLNKNMDFLDKIERKDKLEILMNEVCNIDCKVRKYCYETVSKINLDTSYFPDLSFCKRPDNLRPFTMSYCLKNPSFISKEDINSYISKGFTNFKMNGRAFPLYSLIEMLVYYLIKDEYAIDIREFLANNVEI